MSPQGTESVNYTFGITNNIGLTYLLPGRQQQEIKVRSPQQQAQEPHHQEVGCTMNSG